MEPVFKEVAQVSLVVRDIYETVRMYNDHYGIGPWQIWEFGPDTLQDMVQHGVEKPYSMRAAVTHIGNMEWELIQPLDDESIFAEFLSSHGEGLHHIAFKTEGFQETMDWARKQNLTTEFQGNWYGKHRYAYIGLQQEMKLLAEIYETQPDFVFPAPIAVYPPDPQNEGV